MQQFLDFIILNVKPIVMIIGALLVVIGAIAVIVGGKASAIILILIGAGLAATPVLRQFQAGGEFGINIITSLNDTSETLAKLTDANTKAIEDLRVGFEAMQKLVAEIRAESGHNATGTLVFPADTFRNFDLTTKDTLKKFDLNIKQSKSLNDALSKQLSKQNEIIQRMD